MKIYFKKEKLKKKEYDYRGKFERFVSRYEANAC